MEAAIGPTFGSARTGDYTVNTSGYLLRSFGQNRRFGVQAQGELVFYPGRQEGEIDTTLLDRRGLSEDGNGGTLNIADPQSTVSAVPRVELPVNADLLV